MTALMGIPILGELPSTVDWMAIALISVGVYVVSSGPIPQRRTPLAENR
jgi:drug/metabolite transporter (DMT)-like permease